MTSVIHGDCLEVMATLDAESIDAIVTDPPYGIGFMGKAWDGPEIERKYRRDARKDLSKRANSPHSESHAAAAGTYDQSPSAHRAFQAWCETWSREVLRVAKPGAYLLAFGGTRTVHRMTCAIEDAGWIIRDMLVWGYASGFPKGRANLKPAWEPIVMARKPGPLRMLAIDLCRIGLTGDEAVDDRDGEPTAATRYGDKVAATPGRRILQHAAFTKGNKTRQRQTAEPKPQSPLGRWPANIVLTDPIFDGGWDGVVGGGRSDSAQPYERNVAGESMFLPRPMGPDAVNGYGDSGTYSRFFILPKAARSDREPVLGGLPLRATHPIDEQIISTASNRRCRTCGLVKFGRPHCECPAPQWEESSRRANFHPTVKPVDLMRHLVRLVTPPGGTVLDPFLGSGTTALAAEMEGFAWVGIEREAEYVEIAEARLNGTQRGLGLAG